VTEPSLEQLFPSGSPVPVADAYGDLRLNALAPADRPYVIANMVTSVDGRATLAGRSGGLADETDKELFLELRTQVDAVMAGTATIAIENYGPLVRHPERRRRRREHGLDEVPLAVTATRSMELPVQSPLFQDRGSRIAVLTDSDREPAACPAAVMVERVPGEPLDLLAGMRRLRSAHGVRSVLLEGGPTMLAAMVAAGCVHELFLTYAPKIVGSADQPTIIEGPALPQPIELELLSLLRDESYLFLRYRLGAAR
jgi:riboflavin-specific deaminase-like protein